MDPSQTEHKHAWWWFPDEDYGDWFDCDVGDCQAKLTCPYCGDFRFDHIYHPTITLPNGEWGESDEIGWRCYKCHKDVTAFVEGEGYHWRSLFTGKIEYSWGEVNDEPTARST